jgi:hypothetical protein
MLAFKYRSMAQMPANYYKNVGVRAHLHIINDSFYETNNAVNLWCAAFHIARSPLEVYTAAIRAIATRVCVRGTKDLDQAIIAIQSTKYQAFQLVPSCYERDLVKEAIRILHTLKYDATLDHVRPSILALVDKLEYEKNKYDTYRVGCDLDFGGDLPPRHITSTYQNAGNIVVVLCAKVPKLQKAALKAQLRMEARFLKSKEYQANADMYNVDTWSNEWTLGRIADILYCRGRDIAPECFDAFYQAHPWLFNLASTRVLKCDRVVRKTYENFAVMIGYMPTYQCTTKMPVITVGEYFRLDARDQAMYRDWMAERHV